MLYMKTLFNLSVIAVLLAVAPCRCLADWGIERVSSERAKALGLEFQSKTNSPTQVSVVLEIKTEGELKNFTRGQVGRVDLQIREGATCLVSSVLKEDRSKPGRVVVSFEADRGFLDKITLRVWVAQGLGGDIYELRVRDFVELQKAR
jgi:hypothetical protein